MRKNCLTLTLTIAAGLALSACSGDATPDADATGATEAAVPAPESLPDRLINADGMQVMAESLKETGISGIFEGKGSYTLLAPEDAAFEALGDKAKELTGSDDHSALAALLKAHLIPGYLTPQDISAAIDASQNGEVVMTTLGGDALTFAKSGDTITITAPDGSQANIDGEAITGGASIAIPVDGILKQVEPRP
jgi:uncharacterized surface protein with fasciclin (FAS1) repeats